jgi:hypothetical protein
MDISDEEQKKKDDYNEKHNLNPRLIISEKILMKYPKALDSLKERSFRLVPMNTDCYERRDLPVETEIKYAQHQGEFIVLDQNSQVIVIKDNHIDAIKKARPIVVGRPELYYIRQK